MNRIMAISIALCLVLLTGCSTFTIKSDTQKDVDFSSFATFAMGPPPTEVEGLTGYSEITADRMQKAVAAAFVGQGYEQVERDQADLLIAFNVNGKPRMDLWGDRQFGAWYGSTAWSTTHYTVGTLTIDVFDIAEKKLVWHGWATTEFFESQAKSVDAIAAAQKMVKRFPKRAVAAE